MNTPLPPVHKGPAFHPMMIIAALAVILFCLAGTAAIMGWIPSSISGNRTNGELSAADRDILAARMQADAPAPAAAPVQQLAAAPQSQQYAPAPPPSLAQGGLAPAQNYGAAEAPAPVAQRVTTRAPVQLAENRPARKWCGNCGNIESIRKITTRAQGSGVGAAGGAVLGGLLGNQIGSGHGRQLATVAGAVGGAVVGNQVEGNMKATTSYEIRVRLDDGHTRTFHQQSVPGWRDGDRVKVVNGHLRSVN